MHDFSGSLPWSLHPIRLLAISDSVTAPYSANTSARALNASDEKSLNTPSMPVP